MNWTRENQKLLDDSFTAGAFACVGCIVIMDIMIAVGIKLPEKQYIYMILLVSAILGGLYRFFKKPNIPQVLETKRFTFTITGCYIQNIANTEYDLFILKTTENKIVIFDYCCLDKDAIKDTFVIEIQKIMLKKKTRDVITSLENYSTNKTVEILYFDDDFVEMCIETIEEDFAIFENIEELTQKLDSLQQKK